MESINKVFDEVKRIVLRNQAIPSVGDSRPSELEIEANFYNVRLNTFNRVMNQFKHHRSEVIDSVDFIYNLENRKNLRHTKLSNGKQIFVEKNQLFFSKQDFFKLNVSMETEISQPSNLKGDPFIRNKHRTRFFLNYSYLDFTFVKQRIDNRPVEKYEIEIEYNGKSLTGYISEFLAVLKLVMGTEIIYSKEEKSQIINYLNYDIEPSNVDYVSNKYVNNLVDLEYKNFNKELYKYRITQKTDGRHMFIVYHSLGVYTFAPYTEISKIIDVNSMNESTRFFYNQNIVGTLIEGEFIEEDNCLILFDAVYYQDMNLMNMTHTERMSKMYKFVDDISSMDFGIQIKSKNFYSLRHSNDQTENRRVFIKSIQSCYNEVTDYHNDGIVFIPDSGYLDQIIYKWKPVEKQSIDFYIKDGKAFVKKNDRPELTPFNVKLKQTKINSPGVYECFPIFETEDSNSLMFIPTRLRIDKEFPNSEEVANRNLRRIQDPILLDTLLGKTLKITTKYHRHISRKMYSQFYGSILDIGSGRGGDLDSMKNYSDVTLVEPDMYNVKELKYRLSKMYNLANGVYYRGTNQLKVIECGGEEYSKIPNKEYDVVSMMLSLSFFFGDDSKLFELCRVICDRLKPGGSFIFHTINGYSLKRLIGIKQVHSGNKDVEFKLGGANIKYNSEEDYIEIQIENTIVRGQIEYPVDLKKLEMILSHNGLDLIYLKQSVDNDFIADDEMEFSKLYISGEFIKTRQIKYEIINLPEHMKRNSTIEMGVVRAPESELVFTEPTEPKETEPISVEVNSTEPISDEVNTIEDTDQKDLSVHRDTILESKTDNEYPNPIDDEMYKRIPIIQDENSLIHGVLMACCEMYQSKVDNRRDLANEFRKGLVNEVPMLFNRTALIEHSTYNTVEKVQAHLRSKESLIPEMIYLIADVIHKNIFLQDYSSLSKSVYNESIYLYPTEILGYGEPIGTIFKVETKVINFENNYIENTNKMKGIVSNGQIVKKIETDDVQELLPYIEKYLRNDLITFPWKSYFTQTPSDLSSLDSLKLKESPYTYDPRFHKSGNLDVKFEGKYLAVEPGPYNLSMLSDLFQEPARMECAVRNNISPMEWWKRNGMQAIKELLYNENFSTENLRDVVWKSVKECNTFKPEYAVHMFKRFKCERILDFSAGWGDRLLAACAVQRVTKYLGFDPNTNLKKGHSEMISKYSNGKDIKVIYEPFEKSEYLETNPQTFDMVFTSPPYFDLEIYQGNKQSIVSFPLFEEWKNNFLIPSINKCWNCLDAGGHMIIHIADIGTHSIVEDMNNHILSLPGSFFLGMLGVFDGGMNKVRPAWVWRKSSVSLGYLTMNDLSDLFSIVKDPENMENIQKGEVWDIERTRKFIQTSIEDTKVSDQNYIFRKIQNSDGTMVGIVGLHRISYDKSTNDLFYTIFIDKEYTSKGYGKDAIRMMLKPDVCADISSDNIPSIKAFESIGFTKLKEITIPGSTKLYYRYKYQGGNKVKGLTKMKTYLISGNAGLNQRPLIKEFTKRKYSKAAGDYVGVVWIEYQNLKYDKSTNSIHSDLKGLLNNKKNLVDKRRLYIKNSTNMAKCWDVTESSKLSDLSDNGIFIVKPIGGFSGRDISVVSTEKEYTNAKKLVSRYNGAIVCEYIKNPMLIGGKKFHLRMYLLVVTPPFEYSIFRRGKIFTAKNQFNLNELSKDVHDTHMASTEGNMYFPEDFPEQSMVTRVQSEVERILGEAAKSVSNELSSYPESKQGFEIFGCDLMVTEDGKVVLLEINDKVGMDGNKGGDYDIFSEDYYKWAIEFLKL